MNPVATSPKLWTIVGSLLFLGGLASAWAVEPAAPPKHVRVGDPLVRAQLTAAGGTVVADYGSFQVVAVPDAVWAAFPGRARLAGSRYEPAHVIELNARSIDTRVEPPRKSAGGHRLHLVQFIGPVLPEWRDALVRPGIRVVTHVPHHTFLVSGAPDAVARLELSLAGAGFVQWQGEYRAADKLHPRLAGPATGLQFVQLLADDMRNPDTIAAIRRAARGVTRVQGRVLGYVNILTSLPADRWREIAARDDVVSVHPARLPVKTDERQALIVAGSLSNGVPTGPGYLAWLAARGFNQAQFDASGFVVNITDSGIDNGTRSPGHFALYPGGNTNLASRIAYSRIVGTPALGELAGLDGHGTFNAHLLAGYSAAANAPHTDAAGFAHGVGVAPFVRLGSSCVFDPELYTDPDFTTLESMAYQDGARIDSNSWGYPDGYGAYDVVTQEYDALVRDAQPAGSVFPSAGNQEMVIVFSAGNGGSDLGTVAVPASGKNTLSVGASEGVRSLSVANGGNTAEGYDGGLVTDEQADNADQVAAFSGRGPAADRRFKPDLVAPGTHLVAGVPMTNAGAFPVAVPGFSALGVSALPCTNYIHLGSILLCDPAIARSNLSFFPVGQQFYTVSSGSSHAVPAVSGAAALLRQHFINRGSNPPSPAMTKAWLLNSATYLSGATWQESLPSNSQGMGRLNLGGAFDGVARLERDQVPADKFTGTGQRRSFTCSVSDTSRPVRITVAWTDAPGSTVGPAQNNDLDLTVSRGGAIHRGNVFQGAYSTAGGTADRLNNVESVYLPPGTTGPLTITVDAANINSDGVPNNADAIDQDFALVGYNLVPTVAPAIRVNAITLAAESCEPANGVMDPYEYVTVHLSLVNVGSAATSNLVVTLGGSGLYVPSAPVNFGALTPGGVPVSLPFSLMATGQCGSTLTAEWTVTDGATPLGTFSQSFVIGSRQRTTNTFTQASSIVIAGGTAAPGSPYPSTVTVGAPGGTVESVRVTLNNVQHTSPSDLDILLSAPSGRSVLLCSGAGADADLAGVNLVFDDAAPGYLPRWDAISSGAFRPTVFRNSALPAPAPAPAVPPSLYPDQLGSLLGEDPAGVWSLWVSDSLDVDGGSIGGWTLQVATGPAQCCDRSGADDDRDGFTNAEEVRAGTNPEDVGSALRILEVAETPAGPSVRFPSVAGRTYRLERSDTLTNAVWSVVAAGIAGTGGDVTVVDATGLLAGCQLYRIRLTGP